MKKNQRELTNPDLLEEYDFSNGVRGKHAHRFGEGSNVIILAPDVAEVFQTSDAVNEALRSLIKVARQALGTIAS